MHIVQTHVVETNARNLMFGGLHGIPTNQRYRDRRCLMVHGQTAVIDDVKGYYVADCNAVSLL